MWRKKSILYLNISLFVIVALFVVDTFSPRGHEFIRSALAAVGAITGEGRINYLARFAGGASPSNQIGDSIIYDDGAGRVGIGTTVPGYHLDVAGVINSRRLRISNPIGYMIKSGDFEGNADANLGIGVDTVGAGIKFYTNASGIVKMIIGSSGNVGIGTTAPEQMLHVNGGTEIFSTGPGAGFKFRDRGGGANEWVWYSIGNVARFWRSGVGDLMGITTGGNVGIGTTVPVAKLEVNGAIRLVPIARPTSLVNGMMWME